MFSVIALKLHLFQMLPWERFSGCLGYVLSLTCLAFHVSVPQQASGHTDHCVHLSYSSVCYYND